MAGYTYSIDVCFCESRPECAIGTRTSKYLNCGTKEDRYNFHALGFTIDAVRSSNYKDGTILSNNRNTLYGQIIKGLLVYYSLAYIFPIIKSVRITRKMKASKVFVYTETEPFRQPLNIQNTKRYNFNPSIADAILEESDKGKAIRIASTYWLRAISADDNKYIYKFDRYWRAMDRLLLYQGNTNKERDGIIAIKQVILSNCNLFPLSIQITNQYTENEIRSFCWVKLLSNATKSYTNTKELKRRFTEYTDKRIIKLYKGLIANKKITNSLSSAGFLVDVENHLQTYNSTTNDVELVLLLSITYTYFIRCRVFHGEVPDSMFKIQENNEDKEIQKLSRLLEVVVYELLDNNSMLR